MTEVVVTDLGKTVVASLQTTQIVTSGLMPPAAVASIGASSDVDLTNLKNGGLLVYNSTTQKWVATNLLEQQIFEAGQF